MKTFFILLLFFPVLSYAEVPLEKRAIQEGQYNGQLMIDVVRSYRISVGKNSTEIPDRAIEDAFRFYDTYSDTSRGPYHTPTIGNKNYMVIFDLDEKSTVPRLHIINLKTGEIESVQSANGVGSDPANTGYARFFDPNLGDTNCAKNGIGVGHSQCTASPRGFFTTGAFGSEQHPYEIALDPLEAASGGFPGNDQIHGMYMHDANYVANGHVGRSWGCAAVNVEVMKKWKDLLPKGALFYFYHRSLDPEDQTQLRAPVVSGLNPG